MPQLISVIEFRPALADADPLPLFAPLSLPRHFAARTLAPAARRVARATAPAAPRTAARVTACAARRRLLHSRSRSNVITGLDAERAPRALE
jgi:hypothetical protein